MRRGIVFWMLVGGIIASVAPSPTDFIHFYLQNYLRTATVSSGTFWFWQTVDWYLVDTAWYVFLLGLYYLHILWRKDQVESATVVGVIFSIGLTVGLIIQYLQI